MDKIFINIYEELMDSDEMVCDASCHCDCYGGSSCFFE